MTKPSKGRPDMTIRVRPRPSHSVRARIMAAFGPRLALLIRGGDLSPRADELARAGRRRAVRRVPRRLAYHPRPRSPEGARARCHRKSYARCRRQRARRGPLRPRARRRLLPEIRVAASQTRCRVARRPLCSGWCWMKTGSPASRPLRRIRIFPSDGMLCFARRAPSRSAAGPLPRILATKGPDKTLALCVAFVLPLSTSIRRAPASQSSVPKSRSVGASSDFVPRSGTPRGGSHRRRAAASQPFRPAVVVDAMALVVLSIRGSWGTASARLPRAGRSHASPGHLPGLAAMRTPSSLGKKPRTLPELVRSCRGKGDVGDDHTGGSHGQGPGQRGAGT